MRGFLVLLVLLPVFDLALMGHLIGFWNTVFIVLGSACLGFSLIRHQGIAALNNGRAKMEAGQMPISEMTTGLFLALAGILLVHPGVITDLLGLLCLVPGVRQVFAGWALARFTVMQQQKRGFSTQNDVLEGEFEEVDPEAPKPLSKNKQEK